MRENFKAAIFRGAPAGRGSKENMDKYQIFIWRKSVFEFTGVFSLNSAITFMPETHCTLPKEKHAASRTYESVVRQATCAVKNLILAMNGEKPIAQVNPEVPVKKVVNLC